MPHAKISLLNILFEPKNTTKSQILVRNLMHSRLRLPDISRHDEEKAGNFFANSKSGRATTGYWYFNAQAGNDQMQSRMATDLEAHMTGARPHVLRVKSEPRVPGPPR